MNKFIFGFAILLFSNAISVAQQPHYPSPKIKLEAAKFDATATPNTYQNADNPYYWKNRIPKPGYWQQDVHYDIKATMDEYSDIIDGSETLEYWNNSPDTLSYVFFHLYQNAFQPGSYLDALSKQNNFKSKWGKKYEQNGLGTVVEFIRMDGENLVTFLDNTVMKVLLKKPLAPNSSIKIDIKFKTYFDSGNQRRRMKKFDVVGHKDEAGYRHYDGVHWYPRICVYDAKFGWDTQQHLGKEFYGDYGAFDLELTIASNYVVEATGWLQNKNEVLPPVLREKLDIRNFANKKMNSAPSEITPYRSAEKKTWKYHAENVHDMAWSADPSYRIGEATWNGIQIISMAQESHAAGWQNAASYTAKVIEYYSKQIGLYAYPKMVVCDAQDGMEYPMLTLDGGWDPNYRDLLAHEVGHNWFFGMVGNNETYRAMLDEGFTQFLNTNACEAIDGKYRVSAPSRSWYQNKFREKDAVKNSETYNGYMSDAIRNDNSTLNTHSDDFNAALGHGGGYRNVYFKTSTMLFNLQYVLGDSLFWKAMQHYFTQWEMAHPYPEDFRASIIGYTKVDLNWFFDEWMETSKTIDYAIGEIYTAKDDDIVIELKRKGTMQMPIDLQVVAVDGKRYNFYIPNTWFVKNTTATVMPKWYGWGKLNPTYRLKVSIPSGVADVYIDTTHRLADNNMMNNSTDKTVNFKMDYLLNQPTDWTKYQLKWRPDVWRNKVDVVKIGFNVSGNYMNTKNVFSFSAWFNTHLFYDYGIYYGYPNSAAYANYNPYHTPVIYYLYSTITAPTEKKKNYVSYYLNYNFDYHTTTDRFLKGSSVQIHSQVLEGLDIQKFQFNFPAVGNNTFYWNVKWSHLIQRNYLHNPDSWGFQDYLNKETLTLSNIDYYAPHYTPFYSIENDYPKGSQQINLSTNGGWEHRYGYQHGSGVIHTDFRIGTSVDDWSKVFRPYTQNNIWMINNNRFGKLDVKTRVFASTAIGYLPNESAVYLAGANPEEEAENKFTRSSGWGYLNEMQRRESFYFDNFYNTQNYHLGGGMNLRGYFNDQYFDNMITKPRFINGPYGGQYFNNYFDYYNTSKGRSGIAANVEIDVDDYINFKPRLFRNWLKADLYAFADAGWLQYDLGYNNNSIFNFSNIAWTALKADAGVGCAFTIKKWGPFETVKPLTFRFDVPVYVRHNSPYYKDYFTNGQFGFVVGVNRAF